MNHRAFLFIAVATTALVHCANDGDEPETTASPSSTTTTTTDGAGGAGGGTTASTGGSGTGEGGSGAGAATGGGGMGTGGDGGSGGFGPTVNIQFTIADALTQSPLMGMTVCDHADTSNCGITNASGTTNLTLPDTDVTVEYSGTNYRLHLLSLGQGATSGTVTTFATADGVLASILAAMGVTEDPNQGIVASGADVTGATASLVPASGVGPVYSGTNGFPDTDLTSTSSVGTFIFANVTPGTPELAVTHGSLTCSHDLGVPGSQANQTSILVEAGAITIGAAFFCQ